MGLLALDGCRGCRADVNRQNQKERERAQGTRTQGFTATTKEFDSVTGSMCEASVSAGPRPDGDPANFLEPRGRGEAKASSPTVRTRDGLQNLPEFFVEGRGDARTSAGRHEVERAQRREARLSCRYEIQSESDKTYQVRE